MGQIAAALDESNGTNKVFHVVLNCVALFFVSCGLATISAGSIFQNDD
jgi:hypothetical protein